MSSSSIKESLDIPMFKTNPIFDIISKTVYNASRTDQAPFFLSDWDLSAQNHKNIQQILNVAFGKGQNNAFRYLPADETYTELKYQILKHVSPTIRSDNIALCSSGTSAIFASLNILCKRIKKVLLCCPIYFLYYDILEFLDCEIVLYTHNISTLIDINKVDEIIRDKGIEAIVITDPIFGIGLSISSDILHTLSALCLKYDIWLMVDGLYGGCEWSIQSTIFPISKINEVTLNKKMIYFDSLTKRLGINGNKFALVFADTEFIDIFQNFQLYSHGGFVISQITLLEEFFAESNSNYVTESIGQLVSNAQDTYKVIDAILRGSKIKLLPANAGYFSCISIPKNILNGTNDIECFDIILKKCNVATLPLSLYKYTDTDNYICRLNLLLEKHDLLKNISKLKNTL